MADYRGQQLPQRLEEADGSRMHKGYFVHGRCALRIESCELIINQIATSFMLIQPPSVLGDNRGLKKLVSLYLTSFVENLIISHS